MIGVRVQNLNKLSINCGKTLQNWALKIMDFFIFPINKFGLLIIRSSNHLLGCCMTFSNFVCKPRVICESFLSWFSIVTRLTQWKVVWACSGSSREWRDQSTVGHKYPVLQSDRGKTTWPNSYWQERTKRDNYWYCCTSWCKSRAKRKKKKWKSTKIWKTD